MRLKDGGIDNTEGIIVHHLHLSVAGSIGIRVEFLDKFSPCSAFDA